MLRELDICEIDIVSGGTTGSNIDEGTNLATGESGGSYSSVSGTEFGGDNLANASQVAKFRAYQAAHPDMTYEDQYTSFNWGGHPLP